MLEAAEPAARVTGVDFEPVEEDLIHCWPGLSEPEVIHKPVKLNW